MSADLRALAAYDQARPVRPAYTLPLRCVVTRRDYYYDSPVALRGFVPLAPGRALHLFAAGGTMGGRWSQGCSSYLLVGDGQPSDPRCEP